MAESRASYACDRCRSRKAACSRSRPACQRCINDAAECAYSRSGVIPRARKRKRDSATPSLVERQSEVEDGSVPSNLATDIEAARERLRGQDAPPAHGSLGALTSLAEACAGVWHDAAWKWEKRRDEFFLFEDRAEEWVDAFEKGFNRDRPAFGSIPRDVLDHLRASRPDLVQDRAWLVMYYSITLSLISSSTPRDEPTIRKLRRNLWLALNDARLLLEPSEAHIRALVVLAVDVEEFTKPSLSWMLVTTACRMLQALGVGPRRLDAETRARRRVMFWHLNLVDVGLALIFGRAPTFHRGMVREVPLPTLEQLVPFQPRAASAGTPGLFGVHYIHQIFQLSRLMADIWDCLHNEPAPNDHRIESLSNDLDLWHTQALNILSAAALDRGLSSLRFHHLYLTLLLLRSSPALRPRCIASSKQLLHLLADLGSDAQEPYNGMVWHLLCGPFTPFLDLFGAILSGEDGSAGAEEALAAMEQLPRFLGTMRARYPLAGRLERVAVVLVEHAGSVVRRQAHLASEAVEAAPPERWPWTADALDWDAFFDRVDMANGSGGQQDGGDGPGPDELMAWTNDLFGSAFGDWVRWDGIAWGGSTRSEQRASS